MTIAYVIGFCVGVFVGGGIAEQAARGTADHRDAILLILFALGGYGLARWLAW